MRSKNALVLIACLWLGSVPAWTQMWRPLFSVTVPEVDLAAVSADGKIGVSALESGKCIVVLDLTSGRPVATLEGSASSLTFFAFDWKNDWLVAAGNSEVIRWRISDFRITERIALALQPDQNTADIPSAWEYDPTRELLFRSVGSDLYCYSLRQEGQGKYLKRKALKDESGPLRSALLQQAPKREDLWVLDTDRGELRKIGLDYFREKDRLDIPGALAMAVNNKQVAVLCREQGQYLLQYYDDQLRWQSSYPVFAALPGPDTLKMAFTGRQQLSFTGYGKVWDLSLESGRLTSFDFNQPYREAFFPVDGKLVVRDANHWLIIDDRGRLYRQYPLSPSPFLLQDEAANTTFVLEGNVLRDESGEQIHTLPPEDAFPTAVALRDNHLLLSSRRGALIHYNLQQPGRRILKKDLESGYGQLLFLPEYGQVAGWSCGEKAVAIIDFAKGNTLTRLQAKRGDITALAYHEGHLYLGDSEGGVAVWGLTDSVPLQEDYHYLSDQPIEALAFSPDGSRMLAGGETGVIICRMPCLEVTGIVPGHDNAIRRLQFDPSGKQFISIAGDGMIKVWDAGTRLLLENILPKAKPRDACYFQDKRELLLFTADGQLSVRRADVLVKGANSSVKTEAAPNANEMLQMTVSPDGRLTALRTTASNRITIWENASGMPLQSIEPGELGKQSQLEFWDSQPILLLSGDNGIEYWDARTGRLLKKIDYRAANPRLRTPVKEAGSSALWAISGSENKLLQLDAYTGKILYEEPLLHPDHDQPDRLLYLAAAPKGGRLAVWASGGIYLYDTRKKQPLAFIPHPEEAGKGRRGIMTFSPEGNLLAVNSSSQSEIIIFDLDREEEFFRAPGERAAFLDERRLAVLRNDPERGASIDIWDYLYGGPYGTMLLHPQKRLAALAGRNGLLVAVDDQGRITYLQGQSARSTVGSVDASAYQLTEVFPLKPGAPTSSTPYINLGGWLDDVLRTADPSSTAILPPVEICTVTKATSLRSGAGASHRVLLRLYEGYTVQLLEETDNPFWAKVRYKGRSGWAKKALLKKVQAQ